MIIVNQTQHYWTKLSNISCFQHLLYVSLFLFTIYLLFFGTNTIVIVPPLNDQHSPSTPKDSICSVQGDKWIAVTTRSYPTLAIHKFLNLSTHWNLIIVADQKTPNRLAYTYYY